MTLLWLLVSVSFIRKCSPPYTHIYLHTRTHRVVRARTRRDTHAHARYVTVNESRKKLYCKKCVRSSLRVLGVCARAKQISVINLKEIPLTLSQTHTRSHTQTPIHPKTFFSDLCVCVWKEKMVAIRTFQIKSFKNTAIISLQIK